MIWEDGFSVGNVDSARERDEGTMQERRARQFGTPFSEDDVGRRSAKIGAGKREKKRIAGENEENSDVNYGWFG
jgi:hypothetical protein